MRMSAARQASLALTDLFLLIAYGGRRIGT